jgi:hypothetical protein
MVRRIAQVAPLAALMAIGIPAPSADALGTLSLQADDAAALVRDRDRWRGDWGYRGGRRGDDGWRFRGDDDWRYRRHHGWRGFRDDGGDWRGFRRHRGFDEIGPLFGLGHRYFFGPRYHYFEDGYRGGRRGRW